MEPYQYFEGLPLGVLAVRQGRVVYANGALEQLLGARREELVGRALERLLEGQPAARQLTARLGRRLRGEPVPAAHEAVLRTPRGELRMEVLASRQGEELLFLVRDLTERTASHQVLQRLATLGASLTGAHSEEQVFERMASGLAELRLSFAWLVREGERLRLERTHRAPELKLLAVPGMVGRHGAWGPALLQAWQEGSSWAEDVLPEARRFLGEDQVAPLREYQRQHGPLRLLTVRIDLEGQPRGLLLVGSHRLREEDLPPLRLFGAQVAAAVEAARTISRLSARNQALAALNRLAALAASVEAEGLFAGGTQQVCELIGCDNAGLLLLAEGGTELEVVYAWGPKVLHAAGQRVPLAGSVSEQVLREGVPRAFRLWELPERVRRLLEANALSLLVVVPLRVPSRMVGTLMASFEQPRPLSALELETLQAMGAHFAAATESRRLLAERARLYEDLKRSYAQLERTQQQLVERERLAALGELSAVVAHEVRNPLGAIFNSLATLRRLVDPEHSAQCLLGVLEEEANRLNHFVEDLLGFARPAPPTPRPVGLLRVVEECVRVAVAGQPGVQAQCQQYGEVPEVLADELLLRRALLNLALNAVQSMPQGGLLRVEVRHAPGEPEGVEVRFTDSGPGIAPELRARVFEPFFTTRAGGTGLGLALVQRIVSAHAGRVEVECPPSGGTAFRVWLPLRPEGPCVPAA